MITIAIDGPAGAGKSTVARELARKLNYVFIDTGAMYRAVTLKCLEQNVDLKNADAIVKVAENISIELKPDPSKTVIFVDGKNRSDDIRERRVTENVAPISSNPRVRQRMVQLQQSFGRKGGVIMDGRDIGTVVFPNAELKIFMVADPLTRAQRRQRELTEQDKSVSVEEVLRDIEKRDHDDSSRAVGPLKRADDAELIDTSALSQNEVINKVHLLVLDRINKKQKAKKEKFMYFGIGLSSLVVLGGLVYWWKSKKI